MVAVPKREPLIRPMVAGDIQQVLEHESQAYPFPWTEGIFRDCMRVGYHCYVMEMDSAVCGYSIFSVAVEECHILNICVGKDYRRCGLGNIFLNNVMRHSATMGARQIYLEVRPSNIGAIKLYEALEFKHLARRRDYYPAEDGREDALILIRSIE